MVSKIFYGAGRNAYVNLSRFIKNVGEPVCFIDRDSRKWDKIFPDECLVKYPLDEIQSPLGGGGGIKSTHLITQWHNTLIMSSI
jgi:hypothetical protein